MNAQINTAAEALSSSGFSATYSPDDNKLRLSSVSRLDRELYDRVKAAGFKWAPKQGVFVAPRWTPAREDLLIELCGEIDDEDKSLAERAEERADRFDDYRDRRTQDAEAARKAVSSIADNIPFGQPILVGHHSQARARRDAKRIEDGMRKTIRLWDTADYWKRRAVAALRHAQYKELPAVRARRIKTLEADKRKQERNKAEAEKWLGLWSREVLTHEQALKIANHCWLHLPRKEGDKEDFTGQQTAYGALTDSYPTLYAPRTLAEIVAHAKKAYPRSIAHAQRWINHYEFRIAYEKAMLDEVGGTVADQTGPQVGGGCQCWPSPRGGWSYIRKVNKVSVTVEDNWGNGGGNFTRTIPFDKLKAVMTPAQVEEARASGFLLDTSDGTGFVLLVPPKVEAPEEAAPVAGQIEEEEENEPEPAGMVPPSPALFIDAMKEQLKSGFEVVAVSQLFATPVDLAARMIDMADIQPGHSVLEPSAGSGSLLGAMGGRMFGHNPERGDVVAVELHPQLAKALASRYPLTRVMEGDFLVIAEELGRFDRIVMNPPFANALDIKHIRQAFAMLREGGRLVAICANGPRQQEQLKPFVLEQGGMWEELPAGTFKEAGTGVHVALICVDMD
jgi:protein-L-isoaspartate O-methyltransferase